MGRILGIDILGALEEAIVSLHTIINHEETKIRL